MIYPTVNRHYIFHNRLNKAPRESFDGYVIKTKFNYNVSFGTSMRYNNTSVAKKSLP